MSSEAPPYSYLRLLLSQADDSPVLDDWIYQPVSQKIEGDRLINPWDILDAFIQAYYGSWEFVDDEFKLTIVRMMYARIPYWAALVVNNLGDYPIGHWHSEFQKHWKLHVNRYT